MGGVIARSVGAVSSFDRFCLSADLMHRTSLIQLLSFHLTLLFLHRIHACRTRLRLGVGLEPDRDPHPNPNPKRKSKPNTNLF